MATFRAQCSWQVGSLNATDVCQINPHFKTVAVTPAWQALADSLADSLSTWESLHNQLTVKLYDVALPAPNYPQATAVRHPGAAGEPNVNRDVALCLSFYGEANRPRQRGRLYVPCCIKAINPSGSFATVSNMQACADLVPIFTGLGGTQIDWVVYSKTLKDSHPVTNWWVDNAWDTQRRRGGKATQRQQGTTTEGDAPNLVNLISMPPSA